MARKFKCVACGEEFEQDEFGKCFPDKNPVNQYCSDDCYYRVKDLIKEYKKLSITNDMPDEEVDRRSKRRMEIQKMLPPDIGIKLIFGEV
jgi:hypothetical protein